jgi:quercetin dioxygenase-like cupin family protein
MQVYNLSDFTKGWFLGNFEPSLLKTNQFEISIQHYKKGEFVQPHTHKIATEYNVLISGSMTIQNIALQPNNIFILEPNEITNPVYHEECILLVVKVPCVENDKYLLTQGS